MKKVLKYIGITILVLIVIGFLMDLGKDNNTSATASTDPSTTPTAKQWVQVYTIKGQGTKKSATFHLNGGNTRIRYDYKTNQPGLFSFYVSPQGHDVMQEGGIPELMIQETEQSETYVQKSAGDYYLYINAVGKWDITVEQEQ